METRHILKNSQIIILGLCIAIATIVSTMIFSQGLIRLKKFTNEVIEVTGSAEKNIVSDYSVWRVSFSRRDLTMVTAYAAVEQDLKTVLDYLKDKGFKEEELVISQIETSVLYRKNLQGNSTNEIEAYQLTQQIEIQSQDVQKISEVSRQATELLNQGISLISQAPEYFYTKLGDLKVEMLAQASQNAKQRAEKMAESTGNHIGFMRSARMGVFQITPANSYEISDWGTNDTSALDKKVTAVVRVTYAVA